MTEYAKTIIEQVSRTGKLPSLRNEFVAELIAVIDEHRAKKTDAISQTLHFAIEDWTERVWSDPLAVAVDSSDFVNDERRTIPRRANTNHPYAKLMCVLVNGELQSGVCAYDLDAGWFDRRERKTGVPTRFHGTFDVEWKEPQFAMHNGF